ncbi:MAG TPA: phosphotransferase family protein [Acidimicrobiales bacterium]|nr:phosphotransferase family protein [Acidimicrobiales bacterium]
MADWADDPVLWQSVLATLEDDVLPALKGPAHAVALQLSGLARYALHRGGDPAPARAAQLAPVLGLQGSRDWPEVAAAAADLLVAARRDPAGAPPEADRLRAVLLGFVDEDLQKSAPLLETFARHGLSLIGEEATPPGEAAALEKWLTERLGRPVRHLALRLMSGGHSRRMLDATVTTDSGEDRFVVRVEQGGVFGTEGTSEAAVMRALAGAGVPVAPVRWIEESGQVLGHPFFVMDRVEGDHEVDDASLTLFARALDDLHRMPVGAVAGAFPVRPADPDAGVRAVIDRWEGVYRSASSARIPLLDDAAAWLRANLRPTGPLCVVHGDPGPGNFMHRDGRLVAFTDWEFAHLGDAAEDWVYLGAMRGVRVMPTGEWVRWLRDRVGVDYDPSTWRAWTVLNLFKGACANITALRVFVDGASRGPNLLAVGTALHLRMVRQMTDLIATA